ncbi:MAG: orotidine-5'-phosphate decarboxylase [Chloroflexota bacterium]|nr:orotidine-5'-phosphate decarboxylase [Chloroflexota bacterium]
MEQTTTWAERVAQSIEKQASILCVGLDPVYSKLPEQYKTGDPAQDIFAFNKAVIDQSSPFAAAFKPQYKMYSAEGEAGITALRRTCDYIKQEYPHIPLILDAKYADIGNTLERCAVEAFDLFGVDAVTAMPAPGNLALKPLLSRPGKGCFLVVRTSNPGAEEFQDLQVRGNEPLYSYISLQIAASWNEAGGAALVAPATDIKVLARVRQAAPGLPILCPGAGAQGGDTEAAVFAGLDVHGGGLLINVSRGITEASNPGEAARQWRDTMWQAREKTMQSRLSHPQEQNSLLQEVVLELYKIGAIRFEPVTLKSGLTSPYYNNLRIVASYPSLLGKVSALLSATLEQAREQAGVRPGLLVGIAEAGIPLAVALSQYTGIPAGYVRSAAKGHGIKKMVEGAWPEGTTAVLVDDVVSDGASKLEVLGHLEDAGLRVQDIVVLVDRGQGGVEMMQKHGLRCHAAVKMEQVLSILLGEGLIGAKEVEESQRFMREASAQLQVTAL